VTPERLRRRIHRSLLVVALLSIVLTALTFHLLEVEGFRTPYSERILSEARLLALRLPRADQPDPELERRLAELAAGLGLDAAVLGPGGQLRATTRAAFPPRAFRPLPGAVSFSHRHSIGQHPMPGGGMLIVRPRNPPTRHLWFVPALLVLLLALAAGSRHVARRITRRLEALEGGVRELGGGTLSARVSVEGSDEIASLARTFNWAADRIERLVESQRRMLAAASHELRSPLARLRLVLELLRERARGDDVERRLAEGIADIEELDALVEELLLASRLEATSRTSFDERVELAELVRAEADRVGARCRCQEVSIPGDRRLLRRLVRNLLENAERHGNDVEVEAGVEPLPGGGARLWVSDAGPGVPADERERIFEPFYRRSGAAPGQGVGLGLDLVRRIARHHGGEAACRERPGGGALFEVRLPGRP
jgi:signal transduction histidine kinase